MTTEEQTKELVYELFFQLTRKMELLKCNCYHGMKSITLCDAHKAIKYLGE